MRFAIKKIRKTYILLAAYGGVTMRMSAERAVFSQLRESLPTKSSRKCAAQIWGWEWSRSEEFVLLRSASRDRSPALCARSHRPRSGSESICIGFQHHRPVPIFISAGEVSQTQSRRQVAHVVGPARQEASYRGQLPENDCPHRRPKRGVNENN